MSSLLSRLSGWQRLWIVFNVITLILATIVFLVGKKDATTVEDPSGLKKQIEEDAIHVLVLIPREGHVFMTIYDVLPNTDVIPELRARYSQYSDLSDSVLAARIQSKYPATAIIDFPSNVTQIEVQELFKSQSDLQALRAIASQMFTNRVEAELSKSRAENDQRKRGNNSLAIVAFGGWLLLAGSLYLFGYSIGWIYRGFRRP